VRNWTVNPSGNPETDGVRLPIHAGSRPLPSLRPEASAEGRTGRRRSRHVPGRIPPARKARARAPAWLCLSGRAMAATWRRRRRVTAQTLARASALGSGRRPFFIAATILSQRILPLKQSRRRSCTPLNFVLWLLRLHDA